ncbi:MAG: polysaccharide biosynthesis C-terminal domain-containing protein [Fimbriimonadaceae bacterium]|nr:polysaccharide biosynthesis C-terminal domain-containing protein [Chitinophagales bacterium]
MSNPLRKLAGQTAVYGLSTILVRMLNYLLAPLHTRVFLDQGDYGIISELYAYVTFLNVLFMYGMETAFFRYAKKENSLAENKTVFSTAQASLLFSTILFILPLLFFSGKIADALSYSGHGEYIIYFAFIIAFDTLVNIPFAKLRLQNKPWKYFNIKLLNIGINVLFNFFFLLPALLDNYRLFSFTGFVYNPEHGVAYVFIANLIASAVTFLIFAKDYFKIHFDKTIWEKMMRYGTPLIIIGLAGMTNETLDRILLKYWLPGTTEENLKQVGIYSAVYKISIFMTLAVQAFRMGAEPFFFSHASEKNARRTYADVMKYFVIICCIIFLGVGMFPDIFKIIIGENYHAGLNIVPVLLMANLLLGIYYNQSVWYKLTDKTFYATRIVLVGAAITILVNYLLIPRFSYTGSAWGHLITYFSMVVMSYFIGQKYYSVPYNLRKIGLYLLVSIILCWLGLQFMNWFDFSIIMSYIMRFLLIILFFILAYWLDVGVILKRIKK